MHPSGYDDDYLMTLEDALKSLPNVKPRKARAKLIEWQEEIFSQIIDSMHLNNEKEVYDVNIGRRIVLTSNDFEHLLYDNGYSAVKITPEGAEILIKIYEAGLFDLHPHKSTEKVPDEVYKYSESREFTLERQSLEAERQVEELQKYNELIDNPQKVKLENFTYSLLNDIFIKHFGLKGGCYSMDIGGLSVKKSVYMYTSNSGKSRDSEVTFTWKDLDGVTKEINNISYYSRNRRNDPERNWGLHE